MTYLRVAPGQKRPGSEIQIGRRRIAIDAEGRLLGSFNAEEVDDLVSCGVFCEDPDSHPIQEKLAQLAEDAKHTLDDCYRAVTEAVQRDLALRERLVVFLQSLGVRRFSPKAADDAPQGPPPVPPAPVVQPEPAAEASPGEGEAISFVPSVLLPDPPAPVEPPSGPVDVPAAPPAQPPTAEEKSKAVDAALIAEGHAFMARFKTRDLVEKLEAMEADFDRKANKAKLVGQLLGLPDGWDKD